MKFAKIVNLLNGNDPDYKGVDIDAISGAIYPENNVAYITFEGDIPLNNDLVEITEQTYLQVQAEYKLKQEAQSKNSDSEKIKALEKAQADQDALLMQILLGGMPQ